MLLLQGDAAGANAGFFLDRVLAGLVAAPHGFDKPVALFLQHPDDVLQAPAGIGAFPAVFQRPLVQPVVHLFQQGGHRGLQLVQGHDVLLPTQPGDQHALALFDVLRADLQTQGHPLHLILGKFPTCRIVGIVHLHPGHFRQPLFERGGLFQHARLVLGDGQDDHLHRRHRRGQHQAVVVAMSHDNGADKPGGHPPRGLVRGLQGVVLAGELDAEGLGEAVPKIVGSPRLQRFAVVHQRLDGVGRHRPGKLIALGLFALDNRHSQRVLAEVGVNA